MNKKDCIKVRIENDLGDECIIVRSEAGECSFYNDTWGWVDGDEPLSVYKDYKTAYYELVQYVRKNNLRIVNRDRNDNYYLGPAEPMTFDELKNCLEETPR